MSDIVVLNSDCGGLENEPAMFDSVSSAAVWFAHNMLRAIAGKTRLSGVDEKTFNAIVVDVAVLFAGYDRTTDKDQETVTGGVSNMRWSFGLDKASTMEEVVNELHSGEAAE